MAPFISLVEDHLVSTPAQSALLSNKLCCFRQRIVVLHRKIISAGAVFGNVSRISRIMTRSTRHCAILVVAAADWDTKFPLVSFCIREILF